MCIGRRFALMEAQLIVAVVAQNYRLELVPGCPAEPQPMITRQPHPGLLMIKHKRP